MTTYKSEQLPASTGKTQILAQEMKQHFRPPGQSASDWQRSWQVPFNKCSGAVGGQDPFLCSKMLIVRIHWMK